MDLGFACSSAKEYVLVCGKIILVYLKGSLMLYCKADCLRVFWFYTHVCTVCTCVFMYVYYTVCVCACVHACTYYLYIHMYSLIGAENVLLQDGWLDGWME